jgi:HlyD family secretion protein
MKKQCCVGTLVVVLALLLSGLVGCLPSGKAQDGKVDEIVTVERGSLVTSVTAVGRVLPISEVALSFEISGRVTEVLVKAGDPVRKGQSLARLDTADMELQVRSAAASLAATEAQLRQIKSGPKAEEVRVAQGQLASAQAALDQATAQRDQLVTGTQDSDITVAQAQLDSAKSRVTQLRRQREQVRAQDPAPDVAGAQVELERAKIALDDTQDEYNKALDRQWEPQEIRDSWAKQLQQAKLTYRAMQAQLDHALNSQRAYLLSLDVLAAQIEEAETALKSAEAQLGQAQRNLEPRQRGAEAAAAAAAAQRDTAQAQLDLLLAGATAADIAVAQASVDRAEVTLDSARLSMERAVLRAPFEGIVSRVDIELAKGVGPQVPAVTLVNDTQFSIEADVDEADIGWLKTGQEVRITLDAFLGRSLTGKVIAVLPSATLDLGVVSYRVTIAIDPTDLPLRGGMTANTDIVRERRDNVLLVPNRAIWIDSTTGKPFVERKVGDQIVVAFIEQGMSNDEYSEALSGLQEGDLLAVPSVSVRDRFRAVVTSSMTGK